MRLRLFVPQYILQCAGNECTSIGIIQISWIFHEIDALLKGVVLMSNTIMKCLTNGIVVILLHRVGEKFKVRTDKWGMLQWQLVIIGITACIFFSSMHQKMTMDLDRTNRLFYKNVIINEKRKKDYLELDPLIHSNSFFKTYWTLEH